MMGREQWLETQGEKQTELKKSRTVEKLSVAIPEEYKS